MKGTKKIMKKKNRSLLIRGMVDYLKSDSYFYSPLISPLPSDSSSLHQFLSSPTGLEVNKPILHNKGKLKEKLVEYLKSDTYLYAPLGETKPPKHFAAKTVIYPPKGQELLIKTVTSTILSRKIDWKTKQVVQDSASEKREDYSSKGDTRDASVVSPHTPGLKEVQKQVVRRSHRLSTSTGSR